MNSIVSIAKLGSQHGGRPPAAVEIAPEGVLAAAMLSPGQAPVYAFQPLAAGAIVPGIGEPNLRAPQDVAEAIRSTLEQVSPRARSVTLVLPDTVIRVFVLDFDSLPSRVAEAYPVLRFRLRKVVPFDVEHAALTYQVLKESKDTCKVLAAVMPGAVLSEYEGAVRAVGYEPGAVLPSSLVALEAIDSLEAVLCATMSSLALTTSITNGHDLLLYRTIDLPQDPIRRLDEVRRGIAVAAAYFEDKLMSRPQSLYYAGIGGADAFARWINIPELTVVEMAPRHDTAATACLDNVDHSKAEGPATSSFDLTLGITNIAGVAGALAGVR